MTVLHIITDFSLLEGAQTMLARLLRICPDDRIIVAPLIDASKACREAAANPRITYAPQHARSMPALAGATVKLARLIRKERPSLVLCWMYHAMVVGTAAGKISGTGVPVFWNIRQSLDDPASLSRNIRVGLAMSRPVSGLASGIIYNSERAKDLHCKYGFSDRNSIVIPNGFEIPDQISPRLNKPHMFGIAGRLNPQKDYPTFFRAAALTAETHPQARFAVAGSGMSSDNSDVMSMIGDAGLSQDLVDLRGKVHGMASFYTEIDSLVLSSRTEGFPNVAAEAMSYAKPVVTTDVGDAAKIVGDTGIVVPPRDPVALADAMRKILNLSPQEYCARATAARDRIIENYALPLIADQYNNFLRV